MKNSAPHEDCLHASQKAYYMCTFTGEWPLFNKSLHHVEYFQAVELYGVHFIIKGYSSLLEHATTDYSSKNCAAT